MYNSTQTRHRISGTVDWNSDGYVDIYYPEPSPDAKCAANGTCIKKPSYASKCLSIFYVWIITMQFTDILHLVAYVSPLEQASIQLPKERSNFFLHCGTGVQNSSLHPKHRIHSLLPREVYRNSSKAVMREYWTTLNTKGIPKHLGDMPVPEALWRPWWNLKRLDVPH
jgi:hypothetical protein